jgi:thymidylate synthase (FAD)
MIIPDSFDRLPEALKIEWLVLQEKARDLYVDLRNAGMQKQDARYVLPQAQETELYIAGNYQAWTDFIKLRTSKSAQTEVREVALEIQRILEEVAPVVFLRGLE